MRRVRVAAALSLFREKGEEEEKEKEDAAHEKYTTFYTSCVVAATYIRWNCFSPVQCH